MVNKQFYLNLYYGFSRINDQCQTQTIHFWFHFYVLWSTRHFIATAPDPNVVTI